MTDREAGLQRLRLRLDEPREGLLAPGDGAGRRLLPHQLAALGRVVGGLRRRALVVDDVLGCLYDHAARDVEAGAPRPSGDLVELPGAQQPHLAAVVLGEGDDEDRPDRHVDAHPQGVGAADDREQAALGQPFHEAAVAGQHAGVVHADPRQHQSRQRPAEPRPEPERADLGLDGVFLHLGADRGAHQRRRVLQRGGLGGVHDVHGGLVVAKQDLDGLVQRGEHVVERQRHWSLHGRHDGGVPVGA